MWAALNRGGYFLLQLDRPNGLHVDGTIITVVIIILVTFIQGELFKIACVEQTKFLGIMQLGIMELAQDRNR
jgi:hypothetical protein